MAEKDLSLFRKTFEVNSFLVNFKGQLGLYGILNALQDAAWGHANVLGFGFENISKQSLLWALTRQKLIIKRWPRWGANITIETWLRPSEGYVLREFVILENNEIIGECSTTWLTISAETRRPERFDRSQFDQYCNQRTLSFISPKISAAKESEPLMSFDVRNSDIDVNHHVNNTRYAQWILDSIPHKWHKSYTLNEYEINFLAETKLGDHILIVSNHCESNTEKTRWSQFQGIRQSDQKLVFNARLLITDN